MTYIKAIKIKESNVKTENFDSQIRILNSFYITTRQVGETKYMIYVVNDSDKKTLKNSEQFIPEILKDQKYQRSLNSLKDFGKYVRWNEKWDNTEEK